MTSGARENRASGVSGERVEVLVGRVYLAEDLSLDYRKDGPARSGKVSRMGINGTYQVRDGEVVVDLRFPMLVPGSMRQKVEDDIQRRLDGLFA